MSENEAEVEKKSQNTDSSHEEVTDTESEEVDDTQTGGEQDVDEEEAEEGIDEESDKSSEEETDESSESTERDSYSPEPMLSDLFLGAFICLTMVPLWASPLTGMIAILLSNLLSIPAGPVIVILSLVVSVLAFSYLYSFNYR